MSLTIGAVLQKTTAYFQDKGIPSARLDAEVLLAFILQLDRVGLYTNYDRPLQQSEIDTYRAAIARRGNREPLAYITGHKEFYGLDFQVSSAVLIPRPETELVVEAVLEYLEASQADRASCVDVGEIGVGSGAISVALAKNASYLRITATDISSDALEVAALNVKTHDLANRVRLVAGKYFSGVPSDLLGKLRVVVSNPPYLSAAELTQAGPEVKQEPRVALVAGEDGLAAYRKIIGEAPNWLSQGGLLALEIGADQAAPIVVMIAATGAFAPPEIRTDYAGFDRIVLAFRR